MSNHYQTIKARERLQRKFDVIMPPNWVAPNGGHIYKHNQAPFVINPAGPDNAGGLERECLIGEFGLLPARSRKRDIKRDTLKARSETAAEELSYAIPWRRQHCVIPADCIYEPDWRTGKAIETRIERVDGDPMGLAGLWDRWVDAGTGEVVFSFTMLTIDATTHALMKKFHRAGKDKRRVVIVPEAMYDSWLAAPADESMAFMQQYPAELLVATPEPLQHAPQAGLL
jgi:putative SOS response-associated peptidase YedK